jgi:hypothetical protein
MCGTTDRIANDVDASDNFKLGVEKDRADTSMLKEEFSLSTAEKNQDKNK